MANLAPVHYGWIASGFAFLFGLIINPWLSVPFALLAHGYTFLIVLVDDEAEGRMGFPSFRWWFLRINPKRITDDQIAVLTSLLSFIIGLFVNSWLSIPFAIGGLVIGFVLGLIYCGLRRLFVR
jgi:hypothetical protein